MLPSVSWRMPPTIGRKAVPTALGSLDPTSSPFSATSTTATPPMRPVREKEPEGYPEPSWPPWPPRPDGRELG